MTALTVLISTVADGSMYNRNDYSDTEVIENRRSFLTRYNLSIDHTTRLHTDLTRRAAEQDEQNYCTFHILQPNEIGSGMIGDTHLVADAYVTTEKNHAILLPVADCVGAVLFDPIHSVLMVSHLGRHSLAQQGGTKSVEFLVETFGSNPTDLKVWLTPAPSKENFPIWALNNQGMKEVTFEQLLKAGVVMSNITDNQAETDKNEQYFSYSEFLKGNRDVDGDHAVVAVMTD